LCYADVELGWFEDILQTLGDIGSFEGNCNLSLAEKDQPFVVRWTCLSIMAIRPISSSNVFKEHVRLAVESFGELRGSHRSDEAAEKNAREIDETLEGQWNPNRQSYKFYKRSSAVQRTMEEIGRMQTFDSETDKLNETIDKVSQRITRQLPGVQFDFPDSEPFLQQSLELFRDPSKLRFTSCRRPPTKFNDHLLRINNHPRGSSPSLEGEIFKKIFEEAIWPKSLLQRTLWGLRDFRDGGGLAFAVELFLLALKQLLSTSPSQESYVALYVATFKAITSDWRRHKHSLGTQKILLDAVTSEQGILRTYSYPDYITDEFWGLLGDMLEGQTGPHIDRALTDLQREDGDRYGAKALAVIARLRASSSQAPSSPTA
jgi:hypothetical protein